VSTSPQWLSHRGTVGRAVVGKIKILDESDQELPAGEIGTVYFADAPVFTYHNDPEKTKRAHNGARRQRARSRADNVLPKTAIADQMPEERRLRSRTAAHPHRQIGEAASARSLLAEDGEGLGWAKAPLRRAHHLAKMFRSQRWARFALPTLRNHFAVMPGLVPGIHVFTLIDIKRRGWPGIGKRKRRRPWDGYARP